MNGRASYVPASSGRYGQKITKVWRPVVSQQQQQQTKSEETTPAPEDTSTKTSPSPSPSPSPSRQFNGEDYSRRRYPRRGKRYETKPQNNVSDTKGQTGTGTGTSKQQWIRKGSKSEESVSGKEANTNSGNNDRRFRNHYDHKYTGVSSSEKKEESGFKERASSAYSAQGVGERTFISARCCISKPELETPQQDSINCTMRKDDPVQQRKSDVILEACAKWRIWGNQAYADKKLCKAEEFYTEGINSIPIDERTGCYLKPLVLCYSNRAAVRMASNRIREALEDCKTAASLDPSFLKVQIRAAKCHLSLGEVEDALSTFRTCMESGNAVYLDQKLSMEAANGIKKAEKVAEYLDSCNGLFQQMSPSAATSALSIISEALSICFHSERLLEMKGEALFMLRRYEDVIQLCEQTLDFAVVNFPLKGSQDVSRNLSVEFWRSLLTFKCHFHMGRLELAIDVLEQLEKMRSAGDMYRSNNMKFSIPSVLTLRGVLDSKEAGNEAFNSGRYEDAVEHYTNSIVNGIQSRPFAAICFCNRSAAYNALNQIADAIADCSLAIALDENYIKPLSRRAALHERIGDYGQATTDLQTLVSILEKKLNGNVQIYSLFDRAMDHDLGALSEVRGRLFVVQEKAKRTPSLKHHLILGLMNSTDKSEIRKAYRKLALRHHPDKAGQILARNENGEDMQDWKEIADKVYKDADRLFKLIGEANTVLTDRSKHSFFEFWD
ncbi:dnaJ homolog subfamily C member 7-like isoform X2 [Impatiens glandulifera]|uniref:dnaJ homolog subfamily C member 7-like isoform X2 n=1 Tax=Impatiens glandulifera TaxID=253017 RepID=UPI001FB06B84|nr:dnaJ homolog subfamily C member 7-like isoform X2 [Impatiens glandulifera]